MDFSYSYVSEFLSVLTIVMHRIGVKFEDTVFKKWIRNLSNITGWFLGGPWHGCRWYGKMPDHGDSGRQKISTAVADHLVWVSQETLVRGISYPRSCIAMPEAGTTAVLTEKLTNSCEQVSQQMLWTILKLLILSPQDASSITLQGEGPLSLLVSP